MPAKNATRQARKAQSPSAQAGEYVRQEIEHVREGKHGARSAKQVIAIGLSKARRAGVKLPPPPGKKPLLIPGDYMKSWIFILCSTNQPHYRMPPDTASQALLPKEQLSLIADWIGQGAQNN